MAKLNQLQLISQLYSDDSNDTMNELDDKVVDKTDDNKIDGDKETKNLKIDDQNKCSICLSKFFKYKCPSCLIRTCSLDCFKQHKVTLECKGLKNSLKFKRLENFDDDQLKNDFKFLEDYDRELNGIKRQKRKIVQSMDDLPNWLKKLKYEAFRRMIKLKILPAGFKRRLQNKTTFMYSTKEIHWDVEFVFTDLHLKKVDSTHELNSLKKIKFYINRVSENRILKDLLEPYIKPTSLIENQQLNNLLKFYQNAKEDEILVLIKLAFDYYVQLDPNKTINECLKFKTIIEYPTIVVILKKNMPNYQIVKEDKLKDMMQEWADKNYGLMIKEGIVRKNFNDNPNDKRFNKRNLNENANGKDNDDIDNEKEETKLINTDLKNNLLNQTDHYEESEDDSPVEIQTRFVLDNSFNDLNSNF